MKPRHRIAVVEVGRVNSEAAGELDALSESARRGQLGFCIEKRGTPEAGRHPAIVDARLGHDRRYAIDSHFAQRELNWKPLHNFFKDGLDSTIDLYANNRSWWESLLDGTGRLNR